MKMKRPLSELGGAMAEKKQTDERQDRLAKALRDNLKRRKQAQRKSPADTPIKPNSTDGR